MTATAALKSSRQVAQNDLLERFKEALETSKLSPHCLKLEITESVVMENAEAATLMFKPLRSLGVQLSIDDFGTGYWSLSYLHRFPLNYLKIDRSFVTRLTTDNDNAIVRTISTLARNLGMEVIAEGIETEEQYQQLRMLGCEYGQGFLFSQPVDNAGVVRLLAQDAHRDAVSESQFGPHVADEDVVVGLDVTRFGSRFRVFPSHVSPACGIPINRQHNHAQIHQTHRT